VIVLGSFPIPIGQSHDLGDPRGSQVVLSPDMVTARLGITPSLAGSSGGGRI